MSETLTNGVIVPDKGSRDWYADLRSNWLKLDSLMAGGNITINPAQTKGILVATITVGGREYKLYQQDGDVSVKIDPSTENAEYPLVASTSAEANTGSVVMAPAATVNPSTGAVTATSFKGRLEGNASTATTATKAVQDGAGAVIADTYATKSELTTKANDANVVHKSGTETIVGTKTFSEVRTKFYKSLNLYHNEDYKLNTNPSVKAYQYVFFTGKSGWYSAFLENQVDTDGASYCNLLTRNTNEQSATVQLAIDSKSVKTLKPADNDISLGTSANKWSEVWAKTFNGNLVAKQINNSDSSSLLRIFGGTAPSTGANLDLNGENESTSGGGFILRARNSSGYKVLTGKIDGTLTWCGNNILTDANQIMLAKNLTGSNITPGGVVDCGNGNGKLKQWYLGADGTWLLSDTLPTGVWKSTSFVTLAPNEGGIFIKLS